MLPRGSAGASIEANAGSHLQGGSDIDHSQGTRSIVSGSDEHNRASDYESIADDPQTRSRRTAYAVTGVGSWALDQCRDQSVTPDLSYTDYVLGPLSGEDTRGREHLYASLERADAFRNKNLRKLGFRLLRNKLAGKRQGDVHYDTTKD